jgi:hypothetical protein
VVSVFIKRFFEMTKITLRSRINRVQSTTMDMLMSTIDDIKLKLTDMEYKTLCDQMAVIHKTKDKTEGYCQLKFTRWYPYQYADGDSLVYTYQMKPQTLLIKTDCDMSVVTRLINKVERDDSHMMLVEDLCELTGDRQTGFDLWNEYMPCQDLASVSYKYQDNDEDEPIESVKASQIHLKAAHCVVLFAIRMM